MATTRRPAAKKAVRKSATGRTAAKRAVREPATGKTATRKAAAKKPAAKRPAPRRPARKGAAARGRIARASDEALRVAGVGTDAVARATGKAWDQWLAILDKAGAVAMPHKAIAGLLRDRFGVPPWWSQMVTIGYEQARGLREMYQSADGYSANASRTLQANLDRVFHAWSDPALRALWLGDAPVEVTRSADGRSMRMKWTASGSVVDVNFYPKGEEKSQVTVQQRRLGDRKSAEKQKGFWGGALDRLKAMLEKAA